MSEYSLPSKERLKSVKTIAQIFSSGRSMNKFPIVFKYILLPHPSSQDDGVSLQVAFTVSKRIFKRAVDRNRVKRLIRESHRHHISSLREGLKRQGQCLQGVYIYTGRTLPQYEDLQLSVRHVLKHLTRRITQD